MFGRVACSLFAMTSGFFLIEKEGVRFSRIAMMIFDVLFLTALIAAVVWVTGIIAASSIFTWLFRTTLNWYIIYYVLFSFFIPYVNRLLRSLDRRAFAKLMLTIFVVWSVLPTLTFQQIDFREMDFFIVMYTAGAFIRLHVHGKVKYKNIWNLLIALGAAAVMLLSVPAIDALAVRMNSDALVQNACYFREYNMVPAVIFAVFLFMYFARLTFYSKAINFVAGSVLHILMIHQNEFIAYIVWIKIYTNYEHIEQSYLLAPIKIACMFIGCLLISIAYRLTVRKYVEKLADRCLRPRERSEKERGVAT